MTYKLENEKQKNRRQKEEYDKNRIREKAECEKLLGLHTQEFNKNKKLTKGSKDLRSKFNILDEKCQKTVLKNKSLTNDNEYLKNELTVMRGQINQQNNQQLLHLSSVALPHHSMKKLLPSSCASSKYQYYLYIPFL